MGAQLNVVAAICWHNWGYCADRTEGGRENATLRSGENTKGKGFRSTWWEEPSSYDIVKSRKKGGGEDKMDGWPLNQFEKVGKRPGEPLGAWQRCI